MAKSELQNLIKKGNQIEDPFTLTLKYCSNLVECTDKNSLTHILLESLCDEKEKEVRDETVTFAFNIFSQFPRSTFALSVKAYRMTNCCKEKFIDKIKTIAKDPWINQAAMVAMELNLCNEMALEDILIPLFLENKMSTYMEYMDRSSKMTQRSMIMYLDSLMENNYEFERELNKYNIKNVAMKNLKTLKTQIFKMRDRYGLEEKDAPQATRYHYIKFLKFIMYEYYDNENFTKEIYEDKIKEIADKSEDLQVFLVEHSCERGYIVDGRKWKEHYQLSIDISRYAQTDWSFEKTMNLSDDFYKMSLDSGITFVNDEKSYRNMLEKLAAQEIAGIDCEQQVTNDLSIIQIAVKEETFIIDAMNLKSSLSKDSWIELSNKFFSNHKILKLGCGVFHDVDTIEKFLPIKIDKKASFIDLGVFAKTLFIIPRFRYPYHPEDLQDKCIGLSAITKLCFNKNLDKSLAISNWTVRPLRDEQLRYAALDAYVALDIFHTISDILEQLNLTYKDVLKRQVVKSSK